MATQGYAGALSVLSIGGNSQLEFIKNANFSWSDAPEEGAPASRFGGNTQGTKKSGKLSYSLFSDTSTADTRVSHLDLSAAAYGSSPVSLISPNILSSLKVGVKFTHKMNPGTGELWAYPVVVDGHFDASLKLGMGALAPEILKDFFSATYATQNKVLTFTHNAIAFSIPFRQMGAEVPVAKDGLMEYTMALADRSARAGVTVLPSGTTSLIEKAFNAPKTALAFAFTPASSASVAIAGNMVFESMDFEITDGALTVLNFGFATQGAVTGT